MCPKNHLRKRSPPPQMGYLGDEQNIGGFTQGFLGLDEKGQIYNHCNLLVFRLLPTCSRVYIPIRKITGLPIKGGMTIPVIATCDHGTNGCWFQVFFCHVHPPFKKNGGGVEDELDISRSRFLKPDAETTN